MAFIFLLVSFFLTLLIFPMVVKMVTLAGFVRPNYRKENIPVAVGFIFVLIPVLTLLLLYPFIKIDNVSVFIFLFAIFSMTLLGLMDDFFGSRSASGLKGHFKKLFKDGELTTGALKALGGGVVSLLISTVLQGLHSINDLGIIFLNALIIALATNSINLLDLRPGRAAKGFILGAVILAIIGFQNPAIYFLFLILGCIIAYLPFDLKAKVMMGDTGSNVLGVTLGLISIWLFDFNSKVVLLIMLLLFHVLTEKLSLTLIIEKNPILKFLDMLGRK